jgi:hypothetical protein
MNKICIEWHGEKVTVETQDKNVTLDVLLNTLVIPCLLGLTFSESLLKEYFNDTDIN